MRTRTTLITLVSACVAIPFGAMAQTVRVAPSDETVGVAPPAVVEPSTPFDDARNIAAMHGVVDINEIERQGDSFHVEGRDQTGHHVEMTIDSRTGTVASNAALGDPDHRGGRRSPLRRGPRGRGSGCADRDRGHEREQPEPDVRERPHELRRLLVVEPQAIGLVHRWPASMQHPLGRLAR